MERRRGSNPHAAAGLVRLLSGVGGSAEAAVLRRLHAVEARRLRAAHPRLAAAVAVADWSWDDQLGPFGGVLALHMARPARAATAAAHFTAALPRAACSAVFWFSLRFDPDDAAVARAVRVVHALPPSTHTVGMDCMMHEPAPATFLAALCAHMRRLRALHTMYIAVSAAALAALPPTLHSLRLTFSTLPRDNVQFDHLAALTFLDVCGTTFSDAALATLSRSLAHLIAATTDLTDGARFNHLRRLRTLIVYHTAFGDTALASAPPTLQSLEASETALTAAARFSHLPRLRSLNVSRTAVGDAALASVSCHARLQCIASTAVAAAAAAAVGV